jgi:MAF protein
MRKPTPARFILASSSPRRRELLSGLGIAFSIIKPEVDETQRPGESPFAYVERLSREKAAAVLDQVAAPAVVLAADTVVILAADTIGVSEHGEILGKPADAEDARRILRELRARTHTVCTAITVMKSASVGAIREPPLQITELTRTQVTMRDYSDAEIDAYVASGDPFDKAGSYAIQHPGFHPVAHIEGSHTNVMGLPVETVQRMLMQLGWNSEFRGIDDDGSG